MYMEGAVQKYISSLDGEMEEDGWLLLRIPSLKRELSKEETMKDHVTDSSPCSSQPDDTQVAPTN